jgi:hypothetical protein
MQEKEIKSGISIIKIFAAGAVILIFALLLYNPSGVLNGILDALK